MQVVLGLIDPQERLRRFRTDHVERLEADLRRVLPPAASLTRHLDWRAPNGRSALWCWDEPGRTPELDLRRSAAAVSPGEWTRRPPSLLARDAMAHGSGALSLLVASRAGLEATVAEVGAEPLYLATGPRFTAVSNRALVAAVAAGQGRFDIDLEVLPQYVGAGFGLSLDTPFRGVRAIARGTVVTITRRRFETDLHTTTEPLALPSPSGGPDELAASLAGALVDAMAPLQRAGGEPVELGLTGGKDSRLLAAALAAAEVPFVTQTFGHDGHPDVVVGRQVAQLLGVPHRHQRPQPSSGEDEVPLVGADPLRRAVDAVLLAEGMVSSYENLGSADGAFSPRATMSGTGGGLLRGGYAHMAKDHSPQGAYRYLARGFVRHAELLSPDAQARLRGLLAPWLEAARRDPLGTLDRFYRDHRVGRWLSAGRSAYKVKRFLVQPLMDAEVVRLGASSAVEDRVSELLLYRILKHLEPRLAVLPFADHRWRFEEEGPHPVLGGWRLRDPVTAPEVAATQVPPRFNWRVHYGAEVQEVFREVVLDPARDADLFTFLDRAGVERLLTHEPPRLQHLSWHLFTIATLLSRVWVAPRAHASRPVRIRAQLPAAVAAAP